MTSDEAWHGDHVQTKTPWPKLLERNPTKTHRVYRRFKVKPYIFWLLMTVVTLAIVVDQLLIAFLAGTAMLGLTASELAIDTLRIRKYLSLVGDFRVLKLDSDSFDTLLLDQNIKGHFSIFPGSMSPVKTFTDQFGRGDGEGALIGFFVFESEEDRVLWSLSKAY